MKYSKHILKNLTQTCNIFACLFDFFKGLLQGTEDRFRDRSLNDQRIKIKLIALKCDGLVVSGRPPM